MSKKCVCGHSVILHGLNGCAVCSCKFTQAIRPVTSEPLGDIACKRSFPSGATRDSDIGKLDYEGFLSPLVLQRFAQFMDAHRKQADGTLRASDNWQKGLPPAETLKSLLRHVLEIWLAMRGPKPESSAGLQDSLCAALFNVQSLLFESLKDRGGKK